MSRYFGVVAAIDQWLKNIWISGVRVDLALLWLLPLFCAFAFVMTGAEGSVSWWIAFVCGAVAWFSLAQSRIRHDIVFVATSNDQALYEKGTLDDSEQLAASGRFALWEGDRSRFARIMDRLMSGTGVDRWFLQIPIEFVADPGKTNLFAFTSHIDPSARFFGIALEDKGGVWMLEGTFDSVEAVEHGFLYLGWRSYLALRIRFRNTKGRKRGVVLSFVSQHARAEFLEQFQKASRLTLPSPV